MFVGGNMIGNIANAVNEPQDGQHLVLDPIQNLQNGREVSIRTQQVTAQFPGFNNLTEFVELCVHSGDQIALPPPGQLLPQLPNIIEPLNINIPTIEHGAMRGQMS